VPLPESERLPRRSIVPRLWERSRFVLTGGVIAVVLLFVSLWALFKDLDLPNGTTALLLALFLAFVLIFTLILENKARAREYEEAVAPLYLNHPAVGSGIDMVRILAHTSIYDSDARETRFRVKARTDGKVLFFGCIGDVERVDSYLVPTGGDFNKNHKRLRNRMLTPTMFEVNPNGEAGELWVLTYAEGTARIVTIEWRDPHVS
jgi:hypothetical protein